MLFDIATHLRPLKYASHHQNTNFNQNKAKYRLTIPQTIRKNTKSHLHRHKYINISLKTRICLIFLHLIVNPVHHDLAPPRHRSQWRNSLCRRALSY